MTEQTDTRPFAKTYAETVAEAEKAEAEKQEKQAKAWVRVQQEETDRAQTDRDWKDLGSKSSTAGRDFIRRQCGFDPGW
jgi:hypothetical protein